MPTFESMSDNSLPPDIWLGANIDKVYSGFEPEILNQLVSTQIYKCDRLFGFKRLPTLFWTSEIYGFGRCFRSWLRWPNYLPLPFYSDHGVCFTGHLASHERSNSARYHLTWDLHRFNAIQNSVEKKVLRVPHPWVNYRRLKGYVPREDSKGTLVFYSHSIVGVDEIDYDLENYIEVLKRLPQEFKPLVFCMHMHDVNKGIYKRIHQHGFPVVTAGNTSSQYFVDRFYDLATRFKYATSNSGGSEAYYCSEMGMKYFLMGDPPKYYNHGNPNNPLGLQGYRDEVEENSIKRKNDSFRTFPPRDPRYLKAYVDEVLGMDLDSNTARVAVLSFIRIEMLRLLPRYVGIVIGSILSRVLSFNQLRFVRGKVLEKRQG